MAELPATLLRTWSLVVGLVVPMPTLPAVLMTMPLVEIGAPYIPINPAEPGGITIKTAPTPNWLSFDPFSNP